MHVAIERLAAPPFPRDAADEKSSRSKLISICIWSLIENSRVASSNSRAVSLAFSRSSLLKYMISDADPVAARWNLEIEAALFIRERAVGDVDGDMRTLRQRKASVAVAPPRAVFRVAILVAFDQHHRLVRVRPMVLAPGDRAADVDCRPQHEMHGPQRLIQAGHAGFRRRDQSLARGGFDDAIGVVHERGDLDLPGGIVQPFDAEQLSEAVRRVLPRRAVDLRAKRGVAVRPGDLHAEHGNLRGDQPEIGFRIAGVERRFVLHEVVQRRRAKARPPRRFGGNHAEFGDAGRGRDNSELLHCGKVRRAAPVWPLQLHDLEADPGQRAAASVDEMHPQRVHASQRELNRPVVVRALVDPWDPPVAPVRFRSGMLRSVERKSYST